MPSFIFARTFGTPLADITVCTICAPYECAVSPNALSSAWPEGRQHHAYVQQLVLSSVLGALLNCCCPVMQDAFCLNSLLIKLECYLVGRGTWASSSGCWVWSFAMLLARLMAEFLINTSSNKLNL